MNKKTICFLTATALAATYGLMKAAAKLNDESPKIDADNPYLKDASTAHRYPSFYERTVKPTFGSLASFCGLIALSPLLAATALAIYLDDPGPVVFSQKRVGKDKHYFLCHKFRTMKMDAPHNVPTHLLDNPEQYITKIGLFMRKYSLDELLQLWDVFRHKMSLVGPRPALWNQSDLIAERDRYDANDVIPGITGWAQINGRDELPIAKKAELDGEYTKNLSPIFDLKCLIGTIKAVLRSEGIVEGGTRTLGKTKEML